ncbi:MAG: beta-Ala-His dipeptidase [Firmicutes bacterium]|nr:beta-Ala-His dipeptidase [Bacillota bacterium]
MKNVLNHEIPFEKFFEEISRIPRGSGNEAAVADYLVAFAEERGLWVHRDALHNVIIKKPGTGAGKDKAPLMLQCHSDMVCVKLPGCTHNFETDPIPFVLDGQILRADGTTLGADNGTGMANILTILDAEGLEHPPIEGVFTTSEEVGMFGAQALDYSLLEAKRMIGLDSGGENVGSVNAAGYEQIKITTSYAEETACGSAVEVVISGLRGGHSGTRIHQERANGIKLMADLLQTLKNKKIGLRLVSMEAGQVTNAIPDGCTAVFLTEQPEEILEVIASYTAALQKTLEDTEPDLQIRAIKLAASPEGLEALSRKATGEVIDLLLMLPSGLLAKSMEIPDFTLASANVAIVSLQQGKLKVDISCRAAEEFRLDLVENQILACARVLGMEAAAADRSPCWEYEKDSKLRAQASDLMEKEWGVPFVPKFTHGGLECGYFAKNIPGLDICCIGPRCGDAHGPKEWLDLESCKKVCAFFRKLLTALANE